MKSLARVSYGAGFILCLLLLGFAFYLQYFQDQLPCLLCQLQRISMAAMGIIFLIATCHNPKRIGRLVYFILLLLIGIGGLWFAGRQLWLIAHPALAAETQCSPSLTYLISVLPLDEVLKMSLQGSGDCARVTWRFLSLSLPAWSFIAFSVLLLLNFLALVRRDKN